MNGGGRLRTGLSVALVAGLVAGAAACSREGGPRPGFDATVASSRVSTSPAQTAGASGDGATSEFDVGGPFPSEDPAALADVELAVGANGFTADVVFAGVALGRSDAGVDEVFAIVSLQGDGERSLLSIELSFAICRGGAPVPRRDTGECSVSRIEYGELASPDLTVRIDGTRTISATGDVDTYAYPGRGQRSAGGSPTWTGSRYQLRITVSPRFAVPGARDAAYVAVGTVQIGRFSAREDGRADNVVVLPAGSS